MITDKTADNTGDNNIANHNAIPNASFNTQSTIIDIKAPRNPIITTISPEKNSFAQHGELSNDTITNPKISETINPIPATKILVNIAPIQPIINLLLI